MRVRSASETRGSGEVCRRPGVVVAEYSDESLDTEDDDAPDVEEDDDDEDGAQIMLCMYDKVQRVKNKW